MRDLIVRYQSVILNNSDLAPVFKFHSSRMGSLNH